METNQLVRLHAVPHPSTPVRQAGFPLDHPYLGQCWAPVIGPTSVPLRRRLPVLWRENVSVEIELEELAGSLGLGHLDRLRRPSPTGRPVPSLHR